MAEHRTLLHHRHHDRPGDGDISDIFQTAPTKSQVVAVLTLLPVGAVLLLIAGLTLTGTVIALAVTAPLFLIFSPILVPAALLIAFAVAGFLTSGAFGITALSAISWMVNFLRTVRVGSLAEQVDQAKLRAQDAVGYIGQRTKEAGQAIQEKGHHDEAAGRAREGAASARMTTSSTA